MLVCFRIPVVCRRQWITKYGGGGPAWDKGCDPTLPPREHNREVLFNVWEVFGPQHCSRSYGSHRPFWTLQQHLLDTLCTLMTENRGVVGLAVLSPPWICVYF